MQVYFAYSGLKLCSNINNTFLALLTSALVLLLFTVTVIDLKIFNIILEGKNFNIVMDLINALPDNGSVNTVQHATIEQWGYATHF
jgi:hypothetical protein